MRRYPTDAEVGLPQRGPGLGASMETPVTDGIFNVGPARGFTRGVFTSNPPYATPRYIADMPEGISGMGGCCGGMGAFGEVSCGIDELLDKIIGQFPSVSVSLPAGTAFLAEQVGIPTSFTLSPVASIIKPIVSDALGVGGTLAAPYAKNGANDLADWLAAKIALPISNAIVAGAGVPQGLKGRAAGYIKDLVNNKLRSQLVGFAKEIMACLGVEEPVAKTYPACKSADSDKKRTGWGWENGQSCKVMYYNSAEACKMLGLQREGPFEPHQGGNPYPFKAYRCVSGGISQQLDVNASYDVDKYKGLMTVVAAQQKCFQGGGAWYPGGANCDVAPGGALQNCRAPGPGTFTKYNCVPPGTPGATQQPMSVATVLAYKPGTPQVVVTTKKSNLPLILGAAAVAALLLTKL